MHEKKPLILESMYLTEPPVGRAHFVRLSLTPVDPGTMAGTAVWDPNTCSLDLWGDRGACTRMAALPQNIRATLMRTLDEKGLGRRHWQVQTEGETGVQFHLIEHARAHLWYLVVPGEERGFHVVPLFSSEVFAGHPTGHGEPVPG